MDHIDHMDPLVVTTSTLLFKSNIHMDYKELSKYVKADGEFILGVKSNSISLEECLKNPYTKASKIIQRRKREAEKRKAIPSKSCRATTGNGLYFQSSVEFVVRHTNGRKYNIRFAPNRGSIQIQGITEPLVEMSTILIEKTFIAIKEQMCLEENFILGEHRIIIIDLKTEILNPIPYTFLKLYKLADILNNLIKEQKSGINIKSPYKISFCTNKYKAHPYICVKFLTPIESNPDRKTTIKIFAGRRCTILGAADLEAPVKICKYLETLVETYYDELFFHKPPQFISLDMICDEIERDAGIDSWVNYI
jgi:hypothetical protein